MYVVPVEQLADRGVIRTALDDFGHAWGQRIDRWRADGVKSLAVSYTHLTLPTILRV